MPKRTYKNVRAAAAGFGRILDKAGVPNIHFGMNTVGIIGNDCGTNVSHISELQGRFTATIGSAPGHRHRCREREAQDS